MYQLEDNMLSEVSWEEQYRLALEPLPEGPAMNFRLVLRGHLPADKRGLVDVKQRIRRELHPQLRRLWQGHPMLKDAWKPRDAGDGVIRVEAIAADYQRCGFRFVPLIRENNQMACALDVLLLRRSEPNRLFNGAGDIDGRVKTLLDGLRLPQQCSEVQGDLPRQHEDPFFCLLEDDRLIYHLNVTTDRLLVPAEESEHERDVFAVISVQVKTFADTEISNWTEGFFED